MNTGLRASIEILVDQIAATLAKAWASARTESPVALDPSEKASLALACRYLAAREAAAFKLEREKHLAEVRERYLQQQSSTENDPQGAGETAGPFRLAPGLVILIGWLALGAAAGFSLAIRNLGSVIGVVADMASSSLLIWLLLAIGAAATIAVAYRRFGKRLEHFFSGAPLWSGLQPQSSREIQAERTQILAMVGAWEDDGFEIAAFTSDPDLAAARDSPAPMMPGVADFLLQSGRVKVDDVASGLRQDRLWRWGAFWLSSAVFILCISGAVVATLVFKQDLNTLVELAVLTGGAGAVGCVLLVRARATQTAIAIFDGYVLALDLAFQDADLAVSIPQRQQLRGEAFTALRIGINQLHFQRPRSD